MFVLLTTLGLVQLRHKSDEKRVFKLLIVEYRAIAEAMGFLGTKEAMSGRRGVIGGSETVDGLGKVFSSFEMMDNIVHVFVVGIVRVLEGSLELTDGAVVRILEFRRSERWGVGVTRRRLVGWTIRIGEVIAEGNLQHTRLEER